MLYEHILFVKELERLIKDLKKEGPNYRDLFLFFVKDTKEYEINVHKFKEVVQMNSFNENIRLCDV